MGECCITYFVMNWMQFNSSIIQQEVIHCIIEHKNWSIPSFTLFCWIQDWWRWKSFVDPDCCNSLSTLASASYNLLVGRHQWHRSHASILQNKQKHVIQNHYQALSFIFLNQDSGSTIWNAFIVKLWKHINCLTDSLTSMKFNSFACNKCVYYYYYYFVKNSETQINNCDFWD